MASNLARSTFRASDANAAELAASPACDKSREIERRLREVRVHARALVAVSSLPRWVRLRLRA